MPPGQGLIVGQHRDTEGKCKIMSYSQVRKRIHRIRLYNLTNPGEPQDNLGTQEH